MSQKKCIRDLEKLAHERSLQVKSVEDEAAVLAERITSQAREVDVLKNQVVDSSVPMCLPYVNVTILSHVY